MRSETISFVRGSDDVWAEGGPLNASPSGFVVAALNAASACDRGSEGRLRLSVDTHASNVTPIGDAGFAAAGRVHQLCRPESF